MRGDDYSVCVKCGWAWAGINRCVNPDCRAFCSWGKTYGGEPSSWVRHPNNRAPFPKGLWHHGCRGSDEVPAIIVLVLASIVEFMGRMFFVLLTFLFIWVDEGGNEINALLRPALLDYIDKILAPQRVAIDPTKALVEAYADDRLTVEEFERAVAVVQR